MNLIDSYVKIEIGNEFVRVDSAIDAMETIRNMSVDSLIKYVLVEEYDDGYEDRTVISSAPDDAIYDIELFLGD